MAAHVLCAGIWAVLVNRRPKEGALRLPVAFLFFAAGVTPLHDPCGLSGEFKQF